jgi:hypothetical protein
MNISTKALVFVLIFFPIVTINAQEGEDVFKQAKKNNKVFGFNKELRYTTIGLASNAINYFGDLSPRPGSLSTDFSFTRAGGGIVVNRRIGSRLFIRGAFNYATMRADDFESADPEDLESVDRYARNLHFKNTIYELSGVLIVDLASNHGFYVKRARITPYIFGGMAVFHHRPKARVPVSYLALDPQLGDKGWIDLKPLGTEGQNREESDVKPYHSIQPSVPLGFGVRLKLTKNFDLAFEIGYRFLFFDYIDDVSTEYPDYDYLNDDLARSMSGRAAELFSSPNEKLRDEEILDALLQSRTTYEGADGNTYFVPSDNLPGNQRGDSSDNDTYIVTSLQLTYVLGSPFRKPKVR